MGKVKIKVSNDRLQLVFSFEGRRHYYSMGLPDSPPHRRLAELRAAKIEEDILFGRFTGLDQYRRQTAPPVVEENPIDLDGLWERFLEYKKTVCKQSTIGNQYRAFSRNLRNCPYRDPGKMQRWALGNLTQDSSRRWFVALSACGDWAVKQRLIETNPFIALKLPKGKSKKTEDVNPFTAEERDLIIEKFAANQYYKHYAPFVRFLFATGCRPSEAIGLSWPHISKTHITFCQGATINEFGQLRLEPGLKTQDKRKVPINDRVRDILDPLDRGSKTVFPSPKGGLINFHNFAQRAWPQILKDCDLEYRNPYQMRHTFATLALQADVPVVDLAKLMGNSPEIIYRHYAGASRDLKLPDV